MAIRESESSTIIRHASAPASAMISLAVACSVGSLNSYSLSPFFAPISRDLHVSIPVLGQVTTATWILTAVVALAVGTMADHYGHRLFLGIGLSAVMVSTAGCALAPDYAALLAARLFTSVSAGILEGVTFAFAGILFSEQRRTRVFAILTSSLAISSTLGSPLLTTVASLTSWREAFLVVTAMGALSFALVWRCLPGIDRTGKASTSYSMKGILNTYKTARIRPSLVLLLIASLLYAMPWQSFLTYMGAYFSLDLGFSTRAVGWAFCLSSVAYMAGSLIVGGRIQPGSLHLAFSLSILGAGGCLLLMMTLPWGVPVGLAMTMGICFSAGVAWVVLTSLLTTGPASQYATILSLNIAVATVGAAGGGALGGVLLSVSGWELYGIGLSSFALVAAILAGEASRLEHQTVAGLVVDSESLPRQRAAQ